MTLHLEHFETRGRQPENLCRFYGDLFGWKFDAGGLVPEAGPQPTDYWFVERAPAAGTIGIANGSGPRGAGEDRVMFYVGVKDVAAALQKAERLGGMRRKGPDQAPGRDLVVGRFTDPEGNLIGVAGPL